MTPVTAGVVRYIQFRNGLHVIFLLRQHYRQSNVIHIIYVLLKNVVTTKCMAAQLQYQYFLTSYNHRTMASSSTFKENSMSSSRFLINSVMIYLLSFCSVNMYRLQDIVHVLYVPHKDVWTTKCMVIQLQYQYFLTSFNHRTMAARSSFEDTQCRHLSS